jgi:hypothetical protein
LAQRLGSAGVRTVTSDPVSPSLIGMTFRVLGPHERGRFSPEAWGHLLSLVGTGAVNGGELEHIIERALVQIDGPIALEDLRAFMDAAGMTVRPYPDTTQQSVH